MAPGHRFGGLCYTLPAAAALLRSEVHRLQWTLVQYTLHFVAKHQLRPPVFSHLSRLWSRLGDSKVIEDSRALIRDLEQREQKAHAASCQAVYQQLSQGDVFKSRGLPHVTVTREDWETPPAPPGPNPSNLFHACGVSRVLGKETYTSHHPRESHGAAATLEAPWQLHGGKTSPTVPSGPTAGGLELAGQLWQAGVFGPGTVVQHDPGDPWLPQVYLVLCPEAFTARTAKMVSHGGKYLLDFRATWAWTLVLDAQRWCEVPSSWVQQHHTTGSLAPSQSEPQCRWQHQRCSAPNHTPSPRH